MERLARSVLLLLSMCACLKNVTAQRTDTIHLMPQHVKINSSIFSNVEAIDTRFDTLAMGFVQRGAFNRKSFIRLGRPMKDEVIATVNKLIDGADKQNGTVLFNIRHFFLSELTTMSESGKLQFKASVYLKQDSVYREMFTVDTAVIVRSGWDVTEKLLDTMPEVFGKFVQRAASFDPAQCNMTRTYTAFDIAHIDEVEKRDIPIYGVDIPKKGLYATWEDFKNNRPSSEKVIVQHKKGFSRPLVYEMTDDGKKGKEILRKYYYVVCDGEKMFISRTHNLYALTKINGDFIYTGVGKDVADTGSVIASSILFGAVGGLVGGMLGAGAASSHDTAVFEFRLDHHSGKGIPVKKIKD